MPGDKRYSFIKSGFDTIKEGISAQFIYDKLLYPTQDLLEKTNRALTLRANDPNYSAAVEVLQNCITRMGVALNIPELTQKSHVSGDAQIDKDITPTSSFPRR